jgi:uncharacterized membrane protein
MLEFLANTETPYVLQKLSLIFRIIVNLMPLIFFVCLIIWVVKFLKGWRQENQRLRLEVGKLADELERMRKKGESNEDS